MNDRYTNLLAFLRVSNIYGAPSLADSSKLKSKNVLVIEK